MHTHIHASCIIGLYKFLERRKDYLHPGTLASVVELCDSCSHTLFSLALHGFPTVTRIQSLYLASSSLCLDKVFVLPNPKFHDSPFKDHISFCPYSPLSSPTSLRMSVIGTRTFNHCLSFHSWRLWFARSPLLSLVETQRGNKHHFLHTVFIYNPFCSPL